MSLAIAYAMKKKKKECHGGEMKMAEGGDAYSAFVKGVKNAFGGNEAKAEEVKPMMPKKEDKDMNPTTSGVKKAFHMPGYEKGGDVHLNHEEKESGYEHMSHKHRKHMAEGGMMEEEMESGYEPMPHPCENCGHVSHAVENQGEGEEEDMIGRIMKKRKHFSKGGKVSNEDEPMADSEPAEYDDLVKDDNLEEHYTGKNSGDEDGDEAEDEDRHDIVSRIMKSRKKKDKMPRPA